MRTSAVIYPWVQIYYLVTDPSPSALRLGLVFILSVGSELYKEGEEGEECGRMVCVHSFQHTR